MESVALILVPGSMLDATYPWASSASHGWQHNKLHGENTIQGKSMQWLGPKWPKDHPRKAQVGSSAPSTLPWGSLFPSMFCLQLEMQGGICCIWEKHEAWSISCNTLTWNTLVFVQCISLLWFSGGHKKLGPAVLESSSGCHHLEMGHLHCFQSLQI